jgi:hypothetical protein
MAGGLFVPVLTIPAVLWALADVAWGQRCARRDRVSQTPPRGPGHD